MLQKIAMLKLEVFKFVYISTRGYKEYQMSTNIFARTSQQASTQAVQNKKNETAETAGSLAMTSAPSLLAMNSYDIIQFNNPTAANIDYSNYANYEGGTADASSGFLGGFANAVAVIGTDCSGFSGVSDGGSCSGASSGSCGGGGGFTSFV